MVSLQHKVLGQQGDFIASRHAFPKNNSYNGHHATQKQEHLFSPTSSDDGREGKRNDHELNVVHQSKPHWTAETCDPRVSIWATS